MVGAAVTCFKFLLAGLLSANALTAPTSTGPPFWKTNPVVFRRITEERACIVAAHRDESANGEQLYTAHGGILVSAPREPSFRITQDYAHLGEICDYFKEVDWNPEKSVLHIVIEALGYRGSMNLHLTAKSTNDQDVIEFDIPEGDFRGLSGVTSFEDYGFGKTLMGLDIRFKTKNPPLPKVFMAVAMEVVTQKVGERLRTYIENEPKRLKGRHDAHDSPKL